MLRWGALAIVPLLLLVALGVNLAYAPKVDAKQVWSDLPGSLLGAIAEAAKSEIVASGLALLLLVAFAWAVRQALLAWLVWKPGRIMVPTLEAAGLASGANVGELSTIFRERLALLRIQASAPAPGAAPEGAFLDVLDGVSSSDPLGLLVRLVRSCVPRYALEVQGVLRKRELEPNFGVTVQVAQKPSQAAPVIEFWEHSWEQATKNAAAGVTAAILPRTRLCRGPWAGWKSYLMPPELLIAYEQGAAEEQARRFDQARDRYWEALRLDPTNLTIRLQLGKLQEKAGNQLAALTNYLRILAFGNPGAKLAPRGLYRRGARLECERALTLAKYRAIVLFGDGSILDQWSDLASRQAQLTEKASDEFEKLLKPLSRNGRGDPAGSAIAAATRMMLNTTLPSSSATLRLCLIRHAYRAAEELKLSLSRIEIRPWRRPLTRRTVSLTQLCLEMRCALIMETVSPTSQLDSVVRRVRWAGWRPGPWALWWPSWLRRWQWHEHYNAVCVYAIALRRGLTHAAESNEQTQSAGAGQCASIAIAHLEQAITTRNSEFVANWRDWVVNEDPDLVALRDCEAFRAFQEMYFPEDGPPGPSRLFATGNLYHALAESRYTRDLLSAVAERRRELWHLRERQPIDTHVFKGWCELESELWEHVCKVAETPYDWRVRQELVALIESPRERERPLEVRFLRYDELYSSWDWNVSTPETLRAYVDDRLKKLAMVILREVDAARPSDFARWMASLQSVDPHRSCIARQRRVRLCQQHGMVWDRLATTLEAEVSVQRGLRGAVNSTWDADVKAALARAQEDLSRELARTAREWSEVESPLEIGTRKSPA